MKLHLGCGQVYLEGYTNIDFPMSNHSLQPKSVADKLADLTTLRYKQNSIEEVRLHHTFEHFIRPEALALVASWHSWLEDGGRLHIEVPDFDATAKIVLKRSSSDHDKKVALRHIFGSNEAFWATHYEGWSQKRLQEVYELFGFKVESVEKTAYLATRNISIIGTKNTKNFTEKALVGKAKQYLSGFLVSEGPDELKLLNVWLDQFKKQLKKTTAKK